MARQSGPSILLVAGIISVTCGLSAPIVGVNAAPTPCYVNTSVKLSGDLDFSSDATTTCIQFPELLELNGDLTVSEASKLVSFAAPKLKFVNGGVYFFQNDFLTAVSLPALTNITGALQVERHGSNLTTIDFPLLEWVGCKVGDNDDHYWGRKFYITYNKGVSAVNLPSLVMTKCHLSIYNQGQLKNLVLPSLVHVVGSLAVDGNLLETIDLPTLITVGTGGLMVSRCPNLTMFSAPKLTKVATTLWLNRLPKIKELSFPILESVGDLYVEDNTALTTISFPALEKVTGYVMIKSNTKLSSAVFPKLTLIDLLIELMNNSALRIAEFPLLTSCLGVKVLENPKMTVFKAPLLLKLDNDLKFQQNLQLMDLNLDSFSRVNGKFTISNGGSGTATLSFPKLLSTGDVIYVFNNSGLTTASFPELISAHNNVNFTSNGRLSFVQLPQLKLVAGTLEFKNNRMLQSVNLCNLISADDILMRANSASVECGLQNAAAFVNLTGVCTDASCPTSAPAAAPPAPPASSNGGLKAVVAILTLLLIASCAIIVAMKVRPSIFSKGATTMGTKRLNAEDGHEELNGYGAVSE